MADRGTLIDSLSEWVGSQRWFIGRSDRPSLREVAAIELRSDADPDVVIELLEDRTEARPVLYQVPIVVQRTRGDHSAEGFIDEFRTPQGEPRFAFDGPRHPEFTSALLRLILEGGEHGDGSAGVSGAPVDASTWDPSAARNMVSRVSSGEQSNTSIIFSGSRADASLGERQIICKLFRMLHDGENPDVVLQSAMSAAGSAVVPPVAGSVGAHWPDESRPGGVAHGHLAFAQQFLSDAEDGWALARAAAASGTPFDDEAHHIGVATAEVHAVLASAMPTRGATDADLVEIAAGWASRLDDAIRTVPHLEGIREAAEAVFARARSAAWPVLQRVHGDLHLGQLLARRGGDWVIIDFEGEPLRSLASRSEPDVTLRDVAGMLRSFDYAAGSVSPSPGNFEWSDSCRDAFLRGYAERSGTHVRDSPALLKAFELDKALYEVDYEARNRHSWLPIPLAAVLRLVGVAADSR